MMQVENEELMHRNVMLRKSESPENDQDKSYEHNSFDYSSNLTIYFEFTANFQVRATEGLAGRIGQALLSSLGIIEMLKIEILKKFTVLPSKILQDIKKTWGILDENGVKVQKGKIPS